MSLVLAAVLRDLLTLVSPHFVFAAWEAHDVARFGRSRDSSPKLPNGGI